MITSNSRQTGGMKTQRMFSWVALIVFALALTGCGGGSGTVSNDDPVAAECIPGDDSTAAECGTLFVGLTDGDGDFLSYSVNVMSLQLEKANGATIELLPASTRIDFAQYVNLTEFFTATMLPPGVYVAGSITLDYSDAEIVVEADGAAKDAVITDSDGNTLTETTLTIALSDREQLLITRGRPSLLTVDFDLDASHTVDVISTPAIATAEPFIVAEIDPVDSKDIRVRGPLVSVNEDGMFYTVALRPFYDRTGDFGEIQVQVTEETEFEVDEVPWTGTEGLRALAAAGTGTATVAQGTLNVAAREFTANIVLAGSSFPGQDTDAVKGNVIARNGNDIVVRGGTVILRDTRAFFRDDITVTVGPDTKVYKTTHDGMLDISAISVGQAVTIRGEVTANDELGIHMDATQGAVRMHVTHLSGLVNTVVAGQLDMELHAIDRRRVEVFDFTGTGPTRADDADPANYEVATGDLVVANQATGQPIVVFGFPSDFGAAPPDFEGRSLVDYSDVRSSLGVGWGTAGTIAPFLSMGEDGLVLINKNEDIDERHYIKQGPVLIDLTALESDTTIVPRESGRMLFTVKTTDSLQLYSEFSDFANALMLELDGATTARSMFARGQYDVDTNIFTAHKIFVYLLEP